MGANEFLIASHAVHLELDRLAKRIFELAQFRCADPSNQVFLNVMEQHDHMLKKLAQLQQQAAGEAPAADRWASTQPMELLAS